MKFKLIKVLIFVLGIFLASAMMLSASVNAISTTEEDEIFHIITTVTDDPSSSMMVNYHCKTAGSYVLYTKKYDTQFKDAIKVMPEEELWSTEGMDKASLKSGFQKKRYVCSAKLENLEERTPYIYKIVSGEVSSSVNSFTTSGLTNTWNFAAYTDFQYRRNTLTHKLIKNMKEIGSNPALMVCTGDLVDVADNEDEWTYIFDNEEFSNFVFASSPGDHEYWGDEEKNHPQWDFPYTFTKLMHFPSNGAESSKGTSYYFLYNNVLFVSLDMNNSDVSTGARFQEEVKWFKNVMAAMANKYQYIVVYMHKSIFGSSEVDSSVSKNLRPQWYPVFQEFNVDLVLSGHDHIYSRTYQLNGNKKSASSLIGTYYLDMGSSGDKRRNPDSSLVQGQGVHEKVIDLNAKNFSVASNIEVSDTQMVVKVYNQYKTVVDEFTIKAKREAPGQEKITFNADEFSKATHLTTVNLENNIATLKIDPTSEGKYVTNVKLLQGEKELINKTYNNSGDEEYIVREINGLDCKMEVTLIDGNKVVIDKMLDICNNNDVRLSYDPLKISITKDFIKEYLKNNNFKYEVCIDGNKAIEKTAFSGDIILDNKYYEQDHSIEVLFYTSDDKYVGKYTLSSVKLDPIVLPEEEINMDIKYVLIFSIRYKYLDLIECESDLIEFDAENDLVKAKKEGQGTATFRVKGTNIETTINVTITDASKTAKKTGCNSASAFIAISNALAGICFLAFRKRFLR